MSAGQAILPGKTIGVLGGGQLGRMLAQAATRLGYRVHIYEPSAHCPAGAVAHHEVNAPYADTAALTAFAKTCDVVTYEFENVPAAPLQAIEAVTLLRPHWNVLETTQNRAREKRWLRDNKFPHAKFAEVPAGGDVAAGIHEVGVPCMVKTADFGYDGKGQLKVMTEADIPAAVNRFAGPPVVIEQFIDFACEVSAVVARSPGAAVRVFPVSENIHTNHILDISIVPARVAPAVTAAAEKLAAAALIKPRAGSPDGCPSPRFWRVLKQRAGACARSHRSNVPNESLDAPPGSAGRPQATRQTPLECCVYWR